MVHVARGIGKARTCLQVKVLHLYLLMARLCVAQSISAEACTALAIPDLIPFAWIHASCANSETTKECSLPAVLPACSRKEHLASMDAATPQICQHGCVALVSLHALPSSVRALGLSPSSAEIEMNISPLLTIDFLGLSWSRSQMDTKPLPVGSPSDVLKRRSNDFRPGLVISGRDWERSRDRWSRSRFVETPKEYDVSKCRALNQGRKRQPFRTL